MEQEQVTNGLGYFTMEQIDMQAKRLIQMKDEIKQKNKERNVSLRLC
jgi:hypothetical protein